MIIVILFNWIHNTITAFWHFFYPILFVLVVRSDPMKIPWDLGVPFWGNAGNAASGPPRLGTKWCVIRMWASWWRCGKWWSLYIYICKNHLWDETCDYSSWSWWWWWWGCHLLSSNLWDYIYIYYSDLGLIINSDKLCLDEMSLWESTSGWWFPIPTDYNVAYSYSQSPKQFSGWQPNTPIASFFLEEYSSNSSTSPKKGERTSLRDTFSSEVPNPHSNG